MQIAAQHAEAVGQRAGIGMKERLLLDGIALHSADVSPGHIELAAAVVANFADARLALRDGTAVPASETADAVAVEFLVKFALANMLVDNIAKSGHPRTSAHILAPVDSSCGR